MVHDCKSISASLSLTRHIPTLPEVSPHYWSLSWYRDGFSASAKTTVGGASRSSVDLAEHVLSNRREDFVVMLLCQNKFLPICLNLFPFWIRQGCFAKTIRISNLLRWHRHEFFAEKNPCFFMFQTCFFLSTSNRHETFVTKITKLRSAWIFYHYGINFMTFFSLWNRREVFAKFLPKIFRSEIGENFL